jgi:AcrR family transcriptional regulator
VAKATLYNHFRTKDDVARAALTAELDRVTALAQGRPPPEALLVLAEETARHPVLRRLAETEPELLVRLLGMPGEEWTALVAAVGAVTGLSPADGELATRWLLGLVLQPGTATLRQRCAQRLADHPGHVPDGSGSPV